MKQKTVKKKKRMKRSDIVLLSILLGLLLLGVVFGAVVPAIRNANRLDRAERILREEGFIVLRAGEGSDIPVPEDQAVDLVGRVEGLSGPNGEVIRLMKFKTREKAEEFYEAIREEHTMTRTAVLEGKYVYYGTRTAYEMIK